MRKSVLHILAIIVVYAVGGALFARAEESPAACVKSVRDYVNQRVKAERGRMTSDLYRSIQKEKARRAAECAAAFSLESIPAAEAMSLAELYAEAEEAQKIEPAVARALAAAGKDEAAMARFLVQAVSITMKLPVSPARDSEAERYVARVDALGDAYVSEKIEAHGRMNSYYRADDIDRGIIAHSTKLVELGRKLQPDEKKALAGLLTNAYANLAEAYASLGEPAKALEILRRAPADLSGIADVESRLAPYLERYLLVGKPADPVVARTWINAAPGTERYDPKGSVTLLQFTAHWCGPCRKSYPAVAALQRKYGSRGLKVVMTTQLYGYFQGRQNLSADDEIAADREYFANHLGKEIAVAVVDPPVAREGEGRPVNINDAHYRVGGIPQVHIIDRKGVHRLIMVGFDPSNEERVARFIEGLLDERE